MPFKKVGEDDYIGPSGKHFTKAQVELYYSRGGSFPGQKRKKRRKSIVIRKSDLRAALEEAKAIGRREAEARFDAMLARYHRLKELNGTGGIFKAAWDESKHPRDGGKFASSPGGDGGEGESEAKPTPAAPASASAPDQSSPADSKLKKLLSHAAGIPSAVKRKVADFITLKWWKRWTEKYGTAGAFGVLGMAVALAPLPVPGSVLAAPALADALVSLKRKLLGVGKAQHPDGAYGEAQHAEALHFLQALYAELGESLPDAEPDQNDAILEAMLRVAEDAQESGQDAGPALEWLRGQIEDDATVEKAWQESDHPRGKSGQFISKDRLKEAQSDPAVAEQLRKEVRPEDAHKLEAVISGEKDPGRTKQGQARHEAGQRREAKEASRAKADSIIKRLHNGVEAGGVSVEDLHALADHLPEMKVEDIRRARLALMANHLSAGFGGARRRAEMVASLVAHAKNHALSLRMEGATSPQTVDSMVAPAPVDTKPEPSLQELETGVKPGGGKRQMANDPLSRPYPVKENVGGLASQTSQSDAPVLQGGLNGGLAHAHRVRDLTQTPSFSEHGLRGLNVPTQREVLAGVLTALHDPKIRDHVIQSVPVDVVNDLVGLKSPSEVLLHDSDVFPDLLTTNLNGTVSLRTDAADSLTRAVAEFAAKEPTGPSDSVRVPGDEDATVGTRNGSGGATAHPTTGIGAKEKPASVLSDERGLSQNGRAASRTDDANHNSKVGGKRTVGKPEVLADYPDLAKPGATGAGQVQATPAPAPALAAMLTHPATVNTARAVAGADTPHDARERLVSGWLYHTKRGETEAANSIAAAMEVAGMQPVGTAGETVPFNGRWHQATVGVSDNQPVRITRPGWRHPDEEHHSAERATVEPVPAGESATSAGPETGAKVAGKQKPKPAPRQSVPKQPAPAGGHAAALATVKDIYEHSLDQSVPAAEFKKRAADAVAGLSKDELQQVIAGLGLQVKPKNRTEAVEKIVNYAIARRAAYDRAQV